MKRTLRSIIVCMALVATQFSYGQTSGNTITTAAPNLPKMERYDNVGEAYNGTNHQYKLTENETSLKGWMTNFPDEVVSYKKAIEEYLKTDYSTLTEGEKETFDDLKSQWLMFSQL